MKPTFYYRLLLMVILTLTISITSAYSQPRLALTKLGNKNKIFFYEGDEIWLKVAGGDNYVGGLIIGLRDSVIHFRYFDIPVKEITEIDIRYLHFGGFNVKQYAPFVILEGPLYAGADLLNQDGTSGSTWLQAASISGFGYLLWKFRRKKFKVRKRNKVHILK